MINKPTLRTRRLFRENNRALVVAMDHVRVFDTITGLKNSNNIIKTVIRAGADAILTSYGSSSIANEVLRGEGCWLSVDVTPETIVSIVEMALRLGVDGIKVEAYPWCSIEDDFFKRFSGTESLLNTLCLSGECKKWGLPLMVESIPGGWPKAELRTPRKVAAAARVASEAGADYVKTFYTGDKKSFKEVLDNCPVPIFILGGPKIDTDLDILKMVHDAMSVGAAGITMGRNIWEHSNIEGMTSALAEIIHNDASIESARKLIQ